MSNTVLRSLSFDSAVKYITREGFVNDFQVTFSYDSPKDLQVYVGFKIVNQWDLVQIGGVPSVRLLQDVEVGKSVTIRRATPAGNVPHTYHYTGNAKGGAEFNAVTIDENFEYMSKLVSEVEDFNVISQDNLNDIENEFKKTQDIANEALDTANSADRKADNAVSTSKDALNTAKRAEDKSDKAVSTANSANSTAKDALDVAKRAEDKSDKANTTADTALSTANKASSDAKEALSTANKAEAKSDNANKTSSEAKKIAEGIDAKATEALETSQKANEQARDAVITANVANNTANSIADTAKDAFETSKRAEEKAEEALGATVGEFVVQGTGESTTKAMSQKSTTDELTKKWDIQETVGSGRILRESGMQTVGTGDIVRKSVTDSLDTRVTSAHNRADSAYNLANSKWSPQETVGSGKLMREGAGGLLGRASSVTYSWGSFGSRSSQFIYGDGNSGYPHPVFQHGSGIHVDGRFYASSIQISSLGAGAFSQMRDTGQSTYFMFYTEKNTTVDKSGFLRAVGSANALTESDRTSSLGTSTTLVASQKLVNDVNNKKRDKFDTQFDAQVTTQVNFNVKNTTFYDVGYIWRNNIGALLFPDKSGTLALLSDVDRKWDIQATTGTGNIARMSEVQKAMQGGGIGYGQQWVDVKRQRSLGATYTNNTGKPIMVNITRNDTISIEVDNISHVAFCDSNSGSSVCASVIVPAGSTYSLSKTGTNRAPSFWSELR